MSLRPFWRYYGGKWRSAPRYPAPLHDTVVEPFAGAAGYACRYPDRRVVLVDASPVIAGIWSRLIRATPAEVLSVPLLEDGQTVDDLDTHQEARWLAGFWLNGASAAPRKTPSAWARKYPHKLGWTASARLRVASQVDRIKHWRIIHGDYDAAPRVAATWFVDPPYSTPAGRHYPEQVGDYAALGRWCRSLPGQVVVCEQDGADWLPFRPHHEARSTPGSGPARSSEVVWTRGCDEQLTLLEASP